MLEPGEGTADAAGGGGWGFAVVYATFQVFQTGLWYTVWRQDRRDHREFLATTAGYVVGMGVSATAILGSAFRPPHDCSCGPALRSPGSSASRPPGGPAPAWA